MVQLATRTELTSVPPIASTCSPRGEIAEPKRSIVTEVQRRTAPSTVASVVGAVFEIGKAAANRHIAPPTPKIAASAQTGAGRRRRRRWRRRFRVGEGCLERFTVTRKRSARIRRLLE